MKLTPLRTVRIFPLLALSLAPLVAADKPVAPAYAADTERLRAALTAADDERTAAIKAGDRARLDAIFSDELRYSHSSGKVDSKASYIQSLTSHSTVYESFDYKERTFSVIAPGIATMVGRVVTHTLSGGKPGELDLNFLAVWREEKGKWRFLAWQSCKNPPATGATPGK
jgi:hypothetical protein